MLWLWPKQQGPRYKRKTYRQCHRLQDAFIVIFIVVSFSLGLHYLLCFLKQYFKSHCGYRSGISLYHVHKDSLTSTIYCISSIVLSLTCIIWNVEIFRLSFCWHWSIADHICMFIRTLKKSNNRLSFPIMLDRKP